MNFTDLNKSELLKAANFYKVEVDLDATKANIANALLDAGHTPEDWKRDSEAHDNGAAAAERVDGEEANTDEENALPEPEPVEEKAADKQDDRVLVRFVGANSSYTRGRRTFSRNKPFAVMRQSELDRLPRDKFRPATKAEAKEFYGK